MTKKLVSRNLRLAIALLVALLTASPGQAQDKPLKKINWGVTSLSASNWIPWLAKEAKIYEKHGLDVELILVRGSGQTSAAILGGSLFAAPVAVPQVMMALLAGADLSRAGARPPAAGVGRQGRRHDPLSHGLLRQPGQRDPAVLTGCARLRRAPRRGKPSHAEARRGLSFRIAPRRAAGVIPAGVRRRRGGSGLRRRPGRPARHSLFVIQSQRGFAFARDPFDLFGIRETIGSAGVCRSQHLGSGEDRLPPVKSKKGKRPIQ